ncbi:ABC transporter related protein [Magnetococcus marinus MC-1]|uniref:ABC transporter related protein n=1 Tax=Magnetococcus marinus (strain ATCC BAA-1437 / JCM 17883 / MC-1) TaxID=156889 RepID=A0L530_MAGMM|nr:type I secretion system permease/ATPase [Magnetococcus marinus]ABK43073.1 ABC transporter related protein [Magnetococcus marinus MC-1]
MDQTTPQQPPHWTLEGHDPRSEDPLLGTLLFLAHHWHLPATVQSLTANLPLTEAGLTPELFLRAAEQAGLKAHIRKQPLHALHTEHLPAVLLLHGRMAVVLLGWDEDEAHLLLPESGRETRLDRQALDERYEGHAILVSPMFKHDARTSFIGNPTTGHWFWSALFRYWPIYSEVAVASLLINLFTVASSLFVMNVYDRVVPNKAMETLWVLALGVAIVYCFDFLLRTLRAHFLDTAGKRVDIVLASNIYRHVSGMQLSYQPQSTGAMARNLQEFEPLRDFFTSATLTAIIDLPFTLIFVVLVAQLGGLNVAMVPLVCMPVVILVGLLLQAPLNRVMNRALKESAQKNAMLVETLGRLETIKLNNAEGHLAGKWENCIIETAKTAQQSRFLSTLGVNFAMLVQQFSSVAVVVVGVYAINAGEITMGALIACTILTGRALAPLSQVAGLMVRIQQTMISLRTLNQIMNTPQERPEGRTFLSRPRLSGKIQLKDLSFQYPNAKTAALQKLNLLIEPGEKVGFIGRVGSGKSTLLKLLQGLYPPTEGLVLVDDMDARQIDPADLRRNMGCVTQDAGLLYGTIRENITLGAPFADDSTLRRAVEQGGVAAFTDRHPDGLDLVIGEQGQGLSGGQRQCVSIARALIHNPPILLLDEPTSAMDSGSEERFKKVIEDTLPGKTLLLVTHRASLLSLVDRVVIIEDGQILADGPKEAILWQLKEGKFRVKS